MTPSGRSGRPSGALAAVASIDEREGYAADRGGDRPGGARSHRRRRPGRVRRRGRGRRPGRRAAGAGQAGFGPGGPGDQGRRRAPVQPGARSVPAAARPRDRDLPGRAQARDRGAAGAARGGPLVGRQAELAVLGTALREAVRGHGSVVLVTGEPGLGKTRLVQECRRRAATGTRWLEGRCASYASSTPYSLYQQLLANWAGVTPDQPAAVVGPALERALAAVRRRRPVPAAGPDDGAAAGSGAGPDEPGGTPEADLRRLALAGVPAGGGRPRRCSSWRTCTGPTRPRCASPSTWPGWPRARSRAGACWS